jgi:hypothetical protein
MATLKRVLAEAEVFHKDYLLSRFKNDGKADPEKQLPKQYVWSINSEYWKGLLLSMHKEFYLEELTIGSNDGPDITYTSGYIINAVPTSKCSMQPDGRVMSIGADQQSDAIIARRRPVDQPRTFALGRLQQTDGPAPKVFFCNETMKCILLFQLGRFATITRDVVQQKPKVEEVHTIDDEQAPEPVHSADEKFVAVYQPAGRVLTTIYENDLATLGPTEMLNDTIVDFYMNYILNEIIPAER